MDLRETLNADAPPADLSGPLTALWWLGKGGMRRGREFDMAHDLCQSGEGAPAFDRVHALAHWIEGDMGNSDYWYSRAGTRPGGADPAAEWTHQVEALTR